jgi:hypothetical protein
LDEIDEMGYAYYFQFTITPYGKDIELNVRDKSEIVNTFKDLSVKIGKEKVILRYDPIFFTDKGKYTLDYHIRAFEKLCSELHNYTERVVISFVDDYRKINQNMKDTGMRAANSEDMTTIAEKFSAITRKHNLRLETCAEQIDLAKYGINRSKCIDGELIEKLLGCRISNSNSRDNNREYCGCMKCIDIGQYDTCIHNCLYCYANINKTKAMNNYKLHSSTEPLMLRKLVTEQVKKRSEKDTKSFKIPDEYTQLTIE